MSIPQRLSIVTLGVADLPRSVAFYEAIGWTLAAASNPEIAWFSTSDSVLGLFPMADLAADAARTAPAMPQFSGVTLAINLESEAAVDAAFETAVLAGAVVTRQPESVNWGGYRGYFSDPDGHSWEIAYNPFFPILESGQIRIE